MIVTHRIYSKCMHALNNGCMHWITPHTYCRVMWLILYISLLHSNSLVLPPPHFDVLWKSSNAIELVTSYGSNWITLLLLCTSAPLVFVLWSVWSWFKTGKAWSRRPGNGGLLHNTCWQIVTIVMDNDEQKIKNKFFWFKLLIRTHGKLICFDRKFKIITIFCYQHRWSLIDFGIFSWRDLLTELCKISEFTVIWKYPLAITGYTM